MITGNNGIIKLFSINSELVQSEKDIEKLQIQINDLERKTNGLYERSLDLDLLEEEVKKKLWYINDGEIVIFCKEKKQ